MRTEITVYKYCEECGYVYAPRSGKERPCPECASTEVKITALPNCIYYEDGKCNFENVSWEECQQPYGAGGDKCPVLSKNPDKDRVIKRTLRQASRT